MKKVFLKIWQNSQKNTCARVCSLIKLQTLAQVCPWEFCKTFKNTFITEHLRESASVSNASKWIKILEFKISTIDDDGDNDDNGDNDDDKKKRNKIRRKHRKLTQQQQQVPGQHKSPA